MEMSTAADAVNDTGSFTGARSRPKPAGRVRKILLYGSLALAVILLLSHFAWNASGSNEWELSRDEDGVKVWTLKTPGSNLLKVKAATRVKSSMAGMVKLLEDLESCVDAECYDARVIEPIDTLPGRYAAYIRFKYDVPGFRTQDFVLFQEHYQDPDSKRLEINIIAAPGRIARDECCARVTHLHNSWLLTPLKNGELDIEFVQDTDIVGMPYFLVNLALTLGTHEIMRGMQALMDMDKYRNAPAGIVQELAAN